MADLLRQGADFLEDQRHKHMTRPVVYQRGGEYVALQATVGESTFEQADQFGVVQRNESRDYLIRASDLILAGGRAEPKAGDHIREPIDEGLAVYEVMAIGDEPPFRFSDPNRKTLRIHTRFIGQESA